MATRWPSPAHTASTANLVPESAAPTSDRQARNEHEVAPPPSRRATAEDTGTRTRTGFTSLMQLPLSRRVPIFASIVGLLVLVVVVVFVVAGKASDPVKPVASATPSVSGGDPASVPNADRAIPGVPDPVVSAVASDQNELEFGTTPRPTRPPMHVVRPPAPVAAPPPAPAAPKSSAPTVKKGCDPNYTVDPVTGRKKYKLECM